MSRLKDNSQRNKTVRIVFILVAVFAAIFTVSYYFYTVQATTNGLTDTSEGLFAIVALLYIALRILLIVVFLMWVHRAYKNLIAAKLKNLKYSSPGWSVGVFFIPIGNLFMPFKVVDEIWDKTQRKSYGYKNIKGNTLVIIWWLTFITSGVVENITDKLSSDVNDIYMSNEQYWDDFYLALISNVLSVIAILFSVKMMSLLDTYESDFKIVIEQENSDELTYDELQIS